MIEYKFDSLPHEWKVKKLKDVVTFLDGKRVPIKEADRTSMQGKYPYYGASGIIDYVNDYIFDGNHILLGEDGANIISRSSPLAFQVSGKIWVNNHAHVLEPKKMMDIGFLTEYLESISYVKFNTGTAQPKLPQSTCSKIDVVVPTLPEQRKIAEILSTWDEAIAATERLIAALQQRKKGLMQRLLTGQVRFPGFEGEWRDYKVNQVAKLTAGGTPSTHVPEYWGGEIRWMNSGDIHQKRVYEVENRITQSGLSNSSAKLLPVNSVLIALAGQGKTRGTVAINKVKLSTNQSVAAIIPKEDILYHEYVFYNLDSRYEELRKLSTGDGGRGGLNLGLLGSLRIKAPSIAEQKRIADVLGLCDKEIKVHTTKLDALKQQKKGLMQRLLVGQVRVKV